METASTLTLCLAEAFGVYLIAVGAGALLAPDRWRAIGAELERSPGLTLVTGVFTFAFGAALVGLHHSLADPLAIVITIAAAIGAIEGVLLLVVPELMIAFGRPFFSRPRAWAAVVVVLGLVFLALGLSGRAGPNL